MGLSILCAYQHSIFRYCCAAKRHGRRFMWQLCACATLELHSVYCVHFARNQFLTQTNRESRPVIKNRRWVPGPERTSGMPPESYSHYVKDDSPGQSGSSTNNTSHWKHLTIVHGLSSSEQERRTSPFLTKTRHDNYLDSDAQKQKRSETVSAAIASRRPMQFTNDDEWCRKIAIIAHRITIIYSRSRRFFVPTIFLLLALW